MIYDKANFYFHSSSFAFFLLLFLPQFLAAFQWKKVAVESRFRLAQMENGTKIEKQWHMCSEKL